MKKLKELVNIVTEEKFIPESSIDFESDENQQFLPYQMYQGIKNDEFSTDIQAAEKVYGEATISEKYRRLKWQLKETLYTKLLLISPTKETHSEMFTAMVECNRKLFLVKLLIRLNAKKSAEQLGRHVLEKAVYHSMPTVALEAAQILRELYHILGERRQFEEAAAAATEQRELLVAEDEAMSFWQQISINYVKSTSVSKTEQRKIKALFKKLTDLYAKYDTLNVAVSFFRAKSVILQMDGDKEEVIKNCDEAIEYLRGRPHLAFPSLYVVFYGDKFDAYREMHDYVNAKFNAQIAARYCREGNLMWFQFQHHRFVMCMHSGDYQEAGNCLQIVRKNPKFNQQPDHLKERWKLFEGYYALAAFRNEFTPEKVISLRVERLLNETPIMQTDKAGWNTSLMILQLITYVRRGEIDKIMERLDSLSNYCHRYLYKNETYRTQVFIRMLMVVAKEDLNYRRVERLGRQWVSKLKRYKHLVDPTEIVPYEELWSWILETLKHEKEMVAEYKLAAADRKVG